MPNFNCMHTRFTPKLSDDAIRQKVKEIAKRDVAAGKENFQSEDFMRLRDMFVSSVSPDRKGAITNALTTLEGRISSFRMQGRSYIDLLEWIKLWLNGNAQVGNAQVNERMQIMHLSITDANGNEIAAFHEGFGWSHYFTGAEWSRFHEPLDLYNTTWRAAFNEIHTPQAADNAGQNVNEQNGKPTVDIMGMVIEPPVLDVKT